MQKNTLCYQMHQKWGDNLLKVCRSTQWSLAYVLNVLKIKYIGFIQNAKS